MRSMRAAGAHSENNAERGVILERSEEDLQRLPYRPKCSKAFKPM